MDLISITVDGFRTFREKQTICFPQNPGVYLVRGENEVDPQLEGNDAGKSTLWDSLCWCLYGVTANGLRASNILSWGRKDSDQGRVTTRLEIGGKRVRITRKQNPNELLIDGHIATQENIDHILERDQTEFLNSVLIGQEAEYFLDLGASDKLSIFSEALNLGFWEKKSRAAADQVKEKDSAIDLLSGKIERERGRLEALRDRFDSVQKESNDWSKKAKKITKQLSAELDRVVEDRRQKNKQYKTLKNKRRELVGQISTIDSKLKLVDRELIEATTQLKSRKRSLKDDRCPTCGQDLPESWKDAILTGIDKWQETIDSRSEEKKKLDKQSAKLCKTDSELGGGIRSLENELAVLDRQYKDLSEKLDVGPDNPYDMEMDSIDKEINRAKASLKRLKSRRSLMLVDRDRFAYWVKGFRDLRLWVLDSTLSEFEMHSNNGLGQLGLDRWSVKMAVEKENKTGGISRGFNVSIESPGSKTDSPWKGWGGGVRQRLRLATQMGLANLINSRKTDQPSFEIWDEPTAHLSPQGVQDLLQYLSSRSQSEGKIIYLVDHRSLDFSFDGTLLVTKTLDGSFITTTA